MNYSNALQRAIIYIENHLQEEIRVETVASFVGYSYYHLNRQFIAIIGESVGSYIKKRRLANGARKLIYTDEKIIDIAIENNFNSAEAFSRAFKLKYKVSPQIYRKQQLHTFVSTKNFLDGKQLNHLYSHVTVHPQIIQLPEIKVVGIKVETKLQINKIKDEWKCFYTLLNRIPNCNSNYRKFGIYEFDDQNSHFMINDKMICSEFLAIEIDAFKDIPNGFVIKTIPGGRYAVFTHRGSLDTLPQTINYIWGTWLLSTKEVLDTRETFEIYDYRFLGYNNPDSQIDIYIAIQ